MSSGKEHLSVREAARELGISESLTRDLIRGGQITALRYGPRKTVVYREVLEAFNKQSLRIEAPNTREAS